MNEMNVSNETESIRIVVKKIKIVKRLKKNPDEPPQNHRGFTKQTFRKDILENMLRNTYLTGKELFNFILQDNKESMDERRRGWIFETLCQILIIIKCVQNINYTELYDGQLQNLKQVKNIQAFMKLKVEGGGNNIIDMSIKDNSTYIFFTIKNKNRYSETDVSKIDNTVSKQNITNDYKIGLFVRDKDVVLNHRYKNQLNIDKQNHDKIIENGMLFDEKDVIKSLDVFCERFSQNVLNIDDFIEFINTEYLSSPRQQLTQKLHQHMTELKFKESLSQKTHRKWCIAHKPRSGKSITILLICKYLLEQGYDKILIMTSVPSTIDSFVNDLEKYIDFKDIKYKLQHEIETMEESIVTYNNFKGIVFCSVQYLKTDMKGKKKAFLQNAGFDAIITDESHLGSSTDKTKSDILDVDCDIEDIRKNIKINIFASGTPDKTRKYFNINHNCLYEWAMEDEAYMKQLTKTHESKTHDIIDYMVKRHGNTFIHCWENPTLNKDYSKHPIQILKKHVFPKTVMDKIKEYNTTNGTNYGFSCSSLFALQKMQYTNEKGEPEYRYIEEFEICQHEYGKEILFDFLDYIISKNRMRETVMKQIEKTQSSRRSRKSTVENPLLFLIYLPTHTGNNNISFLQKALKQFLEIKEMWSEYQLEYTNALDDSGDIKETYNEFIESIMNKTRTNKKKGCILLLGSKGTVGITYKECDVTISLDDGHNIDNQQQRFSRALTEADGKTIGINIDMNIQRTYQFVMEMIQKHRKTTKTQKTNAEILYYLFTQNIFIFNPDEVNDGKMTTAEIKSYYEKEAENMMKEIDDTHLLENIICDNDMRNFIKTDFKTEHVNGKERVINKELEGENPDCPKGDTTKTQVDGPSLDTTPQNNAGEEPVLPEEENEKIDHMINQTYEMCKSFMFPLLAIISKSFKIHDFKEIFTNDKTQNLILLLLKDKKIEINESNYIVIVNIMNHIIDNNEDIVNNIREIYGMAPAHKLRELIEKHFIPTNQEKKQNAEVPTPVKLVDEMLRVVPDEFWRTPKKVFEPCCGKGNFVLGIFDRFYKGLVELYPNEIDRCQVIMTECIYYADLTPLNVFITTEIMKCHVQSYCGLEEIDFEFNCYTGDTLLLEENNTSGCVQKQWDNNKFNLVCGNPPYNSSGNTATGNTIWQDFTKKSLNEWILPNGYLLFVHPPGWRKPNTEKGRFNKMFELMIKENQMLYLEIHGIKDGQKVFHCGTRYDWYLIEKKKHYKNTNVIDEEGKTQNIDLSVLNWLPNSNILEINKILAINDEEKCNIIYSPSLYEHRKHWMSHTKYDEFKYPCVHSTPKSGVRYMYSKINNKGHFGIPKVIIGEAGINDIIIDIDGEYGLTNGAIGIKITNIEYGMNIKNALQSKMFNNVLKSCLFSSYRIDWNIFTEFKKDFWKEFV